MSKKLKKVDDNDFLWRLSIAIFLVVVFGYWYLSSSKPDQVLPQTSEEFNNLKIKYSNLLEDLAVKEMLLEEAVGKLNAKPKLKEKSFLFIGILSSPTNYERRQAVRNTWVHLIGEQPIIWKFFIGANLEKRNIEDKIKTEESQYNDIIRISDTPEVYDKLIEKTLNVMKWVNENYEFNYFMKTDDDSFIRPDLLIKELIARNDPKLTYMGFIHQRSFVYRHPSSKFYEPDFNDCETHLPYASGAGYILTQDLLTYLTNNTVPFRKFKNEDAGIGFLLAPVKLNRVHEPRLHPEREGKGKDLCPVSFFLQHRLEPAEFENCYRYITTGNYKE